MPFICYLQQMKKPLSFFVRFKGPREGSGRVGEGAIGEPCFLVTISVRDLVSAFSPSNPCVQHGQEALPRLRNHFQWRPFDNGGRFQKVIAGVGLYEAASTLGKH